MLKQLTALVVFLATVSAGGPDAKSIAEVDKDDKLIQKKMVMGKNKDGDITMNGIPITAEQLKWAQCKDGCEKGTLKKSDKGKRLCLMNMGWPAHQESAKPDPELQACWMHQEQGCCNLIQDKEVWTNFGRQFMKKCINYDKDGTAWTVEPPAFRNVGCIGCNTHSNDLIVANDGSKKYQDTMEELFQNQYDSFKIKRTLSTDYVKNLAYYNADANATWVKPNMETFDSSKGYLKLCASFALVVARITDPQKMEDLGKPITDWDRCGMWDIWTTQLNSLPGTTPEYIRWPSRKFYDWLVYIEWWGMPNMQGIEYVLIDDVTKSDKVITEKDCFKGDDQSMSYKSGIMTRPLAALVMGFAMLASVY